MDELLSKTNGNRESWRRKLRAGRLPGTAGKVILRTEESLTVIPDSGGDALLVTDTARRFTLMNS